MSAADHWGPLETIGDHWGRYWVSLPINSHYAADELTLGKGAGRDCSTAHGREGRCLHGGAACVPEGRVSFVPPPPSREPQYQEERNEWARSHEPLKAGIHHLIN